MHLQLFFELAMAFYYLSVLLGSFEILNGLVLSFTLLPRHVHEFFLVLSHILAVEILDLLQLSVLV